MSEHQIFTKRALENIVDLIEVLFNDISTSPKRNYDEQNEFEAYISNRIDSIRYDISSITEVE